MDRVNIENESNAVDFRGNVNLNFLDLYNHKPEKFCGYFFDVAELQAYANSEGFELIDEFYAYVVSLASLFVFSAGNNETHNGTTIIKPTDVETVGRWLLQLSEGGEGGTAGVISNDFTVTGVTQGGYVDGDIITKGTLIETVIKKMLQLFSNPVYYQPTLSLVGIGVTIGEVGEEISVTFSPVWAKNDAGDPNNYVLKENGTIVASVGTPSDVIIPIILLDTQINFQGTTSYDEGVIKNDSDGNPYPTGHIVAGSKSSNLLYYTGKRKLFYKCDTATTVPIASDEIRTFDNILAPVNGTVFNINIPAGTNRVIFCYPATLRDVSSVKYVEFGSSEVKDTFELSRVDVEGASTGTSIGYKLYSYVPLRPFASEINYLVTI